MAKKEMVSKTILERTYVVPLRKEWLKVPKYKRAKKAGTALKQFLVKHMKSDNVKIGQHLNELIWERGMRNPPAIVKINTVKDSEGLVKAELIGKSLDEVAVKPEDKGEKAEVKPFKETKVKEKATNEKIEAKPEEKKVEEAKPEEVKPVKEKEKTKAKQESKPAEKVPTAAELAAKKK